MLVHVLLLLFLIFFIVIFLKEEDVDQKHWREANRDRILRSLDASLIILHITTSPRISAEVQLEESIDQVISHTKYHLENNIYPEFDLVYRNDGKGEVCS